MCFPNVTARNGFNGRLNFKKPFMTTVWPQHQRIINYKRIINKQILNRHRSEVKKNHHGIHYNTYTYEISTKLSHYFHTCHLLPKFSESRRNSPISQAIRNSISTGEKLNLDYNPQRFRTFSMFAEYNTANSPLSKQLLRVTSIAGGPELQNQARQTKKSFTRQWGFPGKPYTRQGWCGAFVMRNIEASVSRETRTWWTVLQDSESFYGNQCIRA